MVCSHSQARPVHLQDPSTANPPALPAQLPPTSAGGQLPAARGVAEAWRQPPAPLRGRWFSSFMVKLTRQLYKVAAVSTYWFLSCEKKQDCIMQVSGAAGWWSGRGRPCVLQLRSSCGWGPHTVEAFAEREVGTWAGVICCFWHAIGARLGWTRVGPCGMRGQSRWRPPSIQFCRAYVANFVPGMGLWVAQCLQSQSSISRSQEGPLGQAAWCLL